MFEVEKQTGKCAHCTGPVVVKVGFKTKREFLANPDDSYHTVQSPLDKEWYHTKNKAHVDFIKNGGDPKTPWDVNTVPPGQSTLPAPPAAGPGPAVQPPGTIDSKSFSVIADYEAFMAAAYPLAQTWAAKQVPQSDTIGLRATAGMHLNNMWLGHIAKKYRV